MAVELNLLMQVANSLFTLGCGIVLLYLVYRGKLEHHRFYYGWSAGFILYGIQILVRASPIESFAQFPMFLAFIIFFPFSMIVLGSRKNFVFLLPTVVFLSITFLGLSFLGELQYSEPFWRIASMLFYLPVSAVILLHRKSFGKSVDKLLVGWLTLFIVNALLPMAGWLTDGLAILGKSILLFGLLSYDFAIITSKVRNGLTSNPSSPIAGYGERGQVDLVIPKPSEDPPMRAITAWMKNRVAENVKQKKDTSLLIMQDTISYEILRSIAWTKPEIVHVFIFSQDISGGPEFTRLKYGITEIGAAITEIAKKRSESEYWKEIILVDLSIMIHTFGASEVYRLLLNKMGVIRSNSVSLITPFHAQTHDDSITELFKTLASNIIQV